MMASDTVAFYMIRPHCSQEAFAASWGTRRPCRETPSMIHAYDITTYGERIAEVYDQWPGVPQNTEAVVTCLTRLAGRGPVLELGIGTGRIALPLAQRSFSVHGIDASPAMVAQLQAKPGGAHLPVTIGDFADMAVEGRF